MRVDVLLDYLPLYRTAAVLTVRLGFCGIALAMVIGLVCALAQYLKIPVLRPFTAVYIELSRNTPLLIQRFFI